MPLTVAGSVKLSTETISICPSQRPLGDGPPPDPATPEFFPLLSQYRHDYRRRAELSSQDVRLLPHDPLLGYEAGLLEGGYLISGERRCRQVCWRLAAGTKATHHPGQRIDQGEDRTGLAEELG
jgi:hypothetical protein